MYDIWLEDFTEYSYFSDICKVNGNFEFFGTDTIMGIRIDGQ